MNLFAIYLLTCNVFNIFKIVGAVQTTIRCPILISFLIIIQNLFINRIIQSAGHRSGIRCDKISLYTSSRQLLNYSVVQTMDILDLNSNANMLQMQRLTKKSEVIKTVVENLNASVLLMLQNYYLQQSQFSAHSYLLNFRPDITHPYPYHLNSALLNHLSRLVPMMVNEALVD